MRKLYSIVLMATALLIGTNMQAEITSWEELRNALQAGGTVTLTQNIDVTYDANFKSIWIGASTLTEAAPAAVLDLAGHNITITANSAVGVNAFVLTKGSLKVTGTGTIEVKGADAAQQLADPDQTWIGYPTDGTNVFFVFGADDANKVDPKVAPFSKLEIDKNVTVKTKNGSIIAIDAMKSGHAALTKVEAPTGKTKPSYTAYPSGASKGFAYGVFVDVKGHLTSEGADYKTWTKNKKTNEYELVDKRKCYGIKVNGLLDTPAEADKKYAPYVHVESDAVITSDMRSGLAGSTAIYASGFGQWLIEGTCSGASGVYISSGILAVNNATVKSGAEYDAATSGSHANGSGNGITINSRSTRGGEIELTVSGDTKVESTNGYAFEEVINTTDASTKVEKVAIEGGTFVGGTEGAISITPKTATEAEVEVAGGNVSGTALIGTDGLADYLNEKGGTHATLVEDENGKTVLVITKGNAPVGNENVVGSTGSVNWKHLDDAITTAMAETLTADLTLAELEINQAYAQTLTIGDPENADESKRAVTLTIGRVVLGKNAQIIVNPGSKLIVTGEQGIVAPVVDNIVLRASESAQAYFLFNPGVTSNRHPKATVEFISNGYFKSSTDYANQRFGIPAAGALEQITTKYEGSDVATGFGSFDGNSWNVIGFINNPSQPDMDYAKMAEPFAYYQMQHNASNVGTVVTMKGALYGNESPVLNIQGSRWNGFANSFMAPIDGATLINEMIPNTVDKTFYLYDITTAQSVWKSYTLLNINKQGGIRPMQPFLIRNTMSAADVKVDYGDAVYYPLTGETKPGAAPAPRRAINNITMVEMSVKGENTYDELIVAEDAQFSAEFDNGYDAVKYMNEGINMYVSTDEKMSIFATDNLENTYVGFQSVKGGNYTIEFTDVRGEELTLIDHETGAQVAMVEGATYEFTAAANSTNDYRFEIVEPAKLPTAIENTEAVKSAKGIYTITGQYVGEMSVWNTLPAGIYVVNGEKLVK